MDATEAKADSGADSGAATRSEDPKKLVRVFFAIMAVHEHSFRVKDLAPTYLQNQYTQLVDELREALPSDLDDELAAVPDRLDRLQPLRHPVDGRAADRLAQRRAHHDRCRADLEPAAAAAPDARPAGPHGRRHPRQRPLPLIRFGP